MRSPPIVLQASADFLSVTATSAVLAACEVVEDMEDFMTKHASSTLCLILFVYSGCTVDFDDYDRTQLASTSSCRYGTLPDPTGASWRWGGGHGYPDIVPVTCSLVYPYTPTSASDLQSFIDSRPAGSVVYLPSSNPDLEIPSGTTLTIKGSVTLASDRGRITNGVASAGAKLYSADPATPIITTAGNNVRVTGLRVMGADPYECPNQCVSNDTTNTCTLPGTNTECPQKASQGINILHQNIEIDNNDIAGFSHYGVFIEGIGNSPTAYIHHNYIHNVQRRGLGYPVVIGGKNRAAEADIESNRFERFRHAIASTGYRYHSYNARYNLAGAKTIGNVFDVHGQAQTHCKEDDEDVCEPACAVDGWSCTNPPPWAGGRMEVEGNVFLAGSQYSFDVRGKPYDGAWFYSNCTVRSSGSGPLAPTDTPSSYPAPGSDCAGSGAVCQREYFGNVEENYDPAGAYRPNFYSGASNCVPSPRWCVSAHGTGPWRYLNASQHDLSVMMFGDFNGNGKTDILRISGTSPPFSWRVSYDGVGVWTPESDGYYQDDADTAANLRLGDFDGDGKTDVLRSTSTAMQYVRGLASGTWGGWITLNSDQKPIANLAFGRFSKKIGRKADILYTSGTNWYLSIDGSGPFVLVDGSNYTAPNLRFAETSTATGSRMFSARTA